MTRKSRPITSPLICKRHRLWMKKGVCDKCRLEEEQKQREAGIKPAPVIIKKI